MLKSLIKKQMMEVFRSYFYNFKKNKTRTKAGIIGMFLLYAFVMVGVMGALFTGMSVSLCTVMYESGMSWLYFAIMSGTAILLGAFGSVFNTYSGLYLSKDNDLLLSMPIPVKYIIASHLFNVYFMGLIYSGMAILPAIIVYWVMAECSLWLVISGILLMLVISIIVLILSCLLGWCVAKISLKLKNKSFVSVVASLAFIAAYYFFYFKAQVILGDLLANATVYGEKIKGSAYGIYLFGRMGAGDITALAVYVGISVVLFLITWLVLERTFIGIVTSSANVSKTKYREKASEKRTPFKALLSKELSKFTSSPNYMLNCGLGILLIPAAGIMMLIKGPELIELMEGMFEARAGVAWIVISAALCLTTSMNDMSAPSVSLEGKNIWIPQSLPVEARTVLRAKTALHIIMTCIPMLVAVICVSFAVTAGPVIKLLMIIMPLVYGVFSAVFSSSIGLMLPNLSWTNEIVPIKQGGAVAIALFGGWVVAGIFAVLYLAVGYRIGAAGYLSIWTVLLAGVSAILWRWQDKKGAEIFEAL